MKLTISVKTFEGKKCLRVALHGERYHPVAELLPGDTLVLYQGNDMYTAIKHSLSAEDTLPETSKTVTYDIRKL